MAVDTRAELGIPPPAAEERARMEELAAAATECPEPDRHTAIAAGLFLYGPHFLAELEARLPTDRRLPQVFQDAWGMFGAWLGGQPLTTNRAELEQRARAGAELVLRGGDRGRPFDRLVAQCILDLQPGHPLRDTALAESLLRRALETARRANDMGEALRCGTGLLLLVSRAEAIDLIDEGVAALTASTSGRQWLSERASPLPPADEAFWRYCAARYLSIEAMRPRSSSDADERAAGAELAARSISLYQPVVQAEVRTDQPDPQVLANWAHLLMNAGHLPEAAESFGHVRALAPRGSDAWWHACFEEGMVRVDIHDWAGGAERLSEIEPSLLSNYAAFACHGFDAPSPSGESLLRDDRLPSAHREVSEGLRALGLCEAALGRFGDAFVHVETAKAMDFRQRAILHELTESEIQAAPPIATLGHSSWSHGVPPPGTGGRDAQRATLLADRLAAPSTEEVAASLRPDEAVLSIGVSEGTWGVGLRPGDRSGASVSFVRDDLSTMKWLYMLAESAGGDVRGSLLRPLDVAALDATLAGLLPTVNELIGGHIAELVEPGTRVLTVIPDGRLQFFPFWALPSLDADELSISVAANVNMLLETPGERDVSSVSVIVDPTENLPVSFAELAAVRRGLGDGLPIHAVCQDEATPDRVSAAFAVPGIVHFTGHGVSDMLHPSDSALLVSGGSPGSVTALRAAELEAAIPHGQGGALAVLSACDSGRQGWRLDSVVDHSGIAAGLQAGGVSSIVATLWPVSETAAALFVKLLYSELASQEVADVPVLVSRSARRLRALTGSDASDILLELRSGADDPRCRVRLEAYGRRLAQLGSERPFAGPASWACFYHMGTRFLRLKGAR
jgi:CHAT domain